MAAAAQINQVTSVSLEKEPGALDVPQQTVEANIDSLIEYAANLDIHKDPNIFELDVPDEASSAEIHKIAITVEAPVESSAPEILIPYYPPPQKRDRRKSASWYEYASKTQDRIAAAESLRYSSHTPPPPPPYAAVDQPNQDQAEQAPSTSSDRLRYQNQAQLHVPVAVSTQSAPAALLQQQSSEHSLPYRPAIPGPPALPQRPQLNVPQYDPAAQTILNQQHAYQNIPQSNAPVIQPTGNLTQPGHLHTRPVLPPRPVSCGPESTPTQLTQTTSVPIVATTQFGSTLAPYVSAPEAATQYQRPSDDTSTHGAQRFFGNMLVARVGRSGFQSVASTAKLPRYLSPWGDNNPVVLPNLRIRDAAFLGVAHFGVGEIADSAVTLVDHAIQSGLAFTAEAVMDETTHKMHGIQPKKVTRQMNALTLELRIRHKLMGQDANIRLWEEREALNTSCCAKGWFCPYFYASGRTPQLLRSRDFVMAEFFGPGLAADAAITATLINSLADSGAPITALCPYQAIPETQPYYPRLAVMLTGISPWRTNTAWSQARNPNEARLRFHLLTNTPALVIPVTRQMPVCSWSPWTVQQIARMENGWHLERHVREIVGYLDTVADTSMMYQDRAAYWKATAADCLRQTLTAAHQVAVFGNANTFLNPERAGIVLMRY